MKLLNRMKILIKIMKKDKLKNLRKLEKEGFIYSFFLLIILVLELFIKLKSMVQMKNMHSKFFLMNSILKSEKHLLNGFRNIKC